MKSVLKGKLFGVAVSVLGMSLCAPAAVRAAESDVIRNGVFADTVDLGGLNVSEAKAKVEDYVESLKENEVVFVVSDNKEVTVSAGDLGISWADEDIIDEALKIGTEGNIIERYKAIKDLEHENKVFDVCVSADRETVESVVTNKCTQYDRPAKNYSLKREGGAFTVVDGQTGYGLNIEESVDEIMDYLENSWDKTGCVITLPVEETLPKGNKEELSQVKDLLGSFTTSYSSSGSSRSANVANGCNHINGTTVYPGETFSTYKTVSPFTEANGYYLAGSYLNGKVVDSFGGGICQVSTTLYNAVLLAELEVTERNNHSMIVSYVSPSADAAIAESAGKDFCFKNNTDYPIYIEGYTNNKHITFNIYGKETRDPNRTVKYESEVLETMTASHDNIYADGSHGIGYIVTESSHTGYKARLWKIVYENGAEVSREIVNSSTYKLVPRSATVGVATEDPNAYNEIMAAIGTGSIDHVKAVIAQIQAGAVPAPDPAQEAPAEPQGEPAQ
ncbi:MAG: VanW family protein [Lachnospiraceae bacterium]|nr:VanW family protein [Lachnospiraceae bacterium]